MAERSEPSTARLIATLALFLAIGGPAAYFLWHSLSDLLYGRIHEVSIPGLIGGGVVFTAVLWTLGRWVRRQAI
jgi:hypothetical protein